MDQKICPLTTLYTEKQRREIRLIAARLDISSSELIRNAVTSYIESLESQDSQNDLAQAA